MKLWLRIQIFLKKYENPCKTNSEKISSVFKNKKSNSYQTWIKSLLGGNRKQHITEKY